MAETNKTEKATPKKRRDERKKGNAFQSKDVVSVVLIVIGFFLISNLGIFIKMQIEKLYIRQMHNIEGLYTLTIVDCMLIMREALQVFFITTIPIVIIFAFTAVIMTGVQTGFLVSGDLLKFKYNRISIIEGFKRLLSLRSVVQLVKSLIKVIIIIWIIYSSIKDLLLVTPDILNTSLDSTISFMMDRIMSMVYKICLIFVGVAILDYSY